MFLVLRLAAAMLCGTGAGWAIRFWWGWQDGPTVLAAAGAAGQGVFAAVAWLGRPSDETARLQSKVFTPWALATMALAMAATVFLLHFPATVIAPVASYLLIRVLLEGQDRGHGKSLGGLSLQIAARGGEIVTVLAAIMRVPL